MGCVVLDYLLFQVKDLLSFYELFLLHIGEELMGDHVIFQDKVGFRELFDDFLGGHIVDLSESVEPPDMYEHGLEDPGEVSCKL
jgi:hypothetical protein